MALSLTEVIALRRLAGVYRRILVLAVPAALAGCQGGGDALAPESTDGAAEVSSPATEPIAGDAVASLTSTGRIAFSVIAGEEQTDVWTMNPNGSGQTRLTSYAGNEINPVWSADHQRIAFERGRNGKIDIMLMNADGTNKHWALSTQSSYYLTAPSWAPDGKSILVQAWNTPSKMYVGKIDLTTGKFLILAPAGYYNLPGQWPVYDKDGKWIYYVEPTYHSIHRFQPYGSDFWVSGGGGAPGDLAFSPDGTKLALCKVVDSGNREIMVLDLLSHHYTRLTTNSANDNHPAWSPDGTLIALTSDRSGTPQIYTMNSSDGGNLKKITNKTNGAAYPSWYR